MPKISLIYIDNKIILTNKKGIKNILIFGLSYKSNLKVHILSPTLQLVKYLKKKSANVTLFDPLYSKHEVKKIIDVKTINEIITLKNFDAIIMMINHEHFNKIDLIKLIKNSGLKIILDNSNYFKNKKNLIPNEINYIQTGQAGWLN